MSPQKAVHSDYLIHWTGKDIDEAHGESDWHKPPKKGEPPRKSKDPHNSAVPYIERLRDTLKYGLWLTTDKENPSISIGCHNVTPPNTPRTCFTELKLSESRFHAIKYGRLGIGFKRPYALIKGGRPIVYYGFKRDQPNDALLEACVKDSTKHYLLDFFKPMNSSSTLNYDFYSESEWRLLFTNDLLDKKIIIDPRNPKNKEHHAYFNSLAKEKQDALKYFLKVDSWLSMIIYPSIYSKNLAQQDSKFDIHSEISRIKELHKPPGAHRTCHGNIVEKGNWPIEIDLDSCSHL